MTPLLLPGAGPDTHTSLPARAHPHTHTHTHTRSLAAVSHPARQKGRTAPSSKGKTPSAGDEGPAKVHCPPRTRVRVRERAQHRRALSHAALSRRRSSLPGIGPATHYCPSLPARSASTARVQCVTSPPTPTPTRPAFARAPARAYHMPSLSHTRHCLTPGTAGERGGSWRDQGQGSLLETRALPRYCPPPAGPHARAHRRGSLSPSAFSRRRSSLSYIGPGSHYCTFLPARAASTVRVRGD